MNTHTLPHLPLNRTMKYQVGFHGLNSLIFSVLTHVFAIGLIMWCLHRQAQLKHELLMDLGSLGRCGGGPMSQRWPTVQRPVPPTETAGKSRPDASKSVNAILRQSHQTLLGPLAVAPAYFDAAAVFFFMRDTDKDNKLRLWECCQNDPLKKQRFAAADQNRDGYLSREEFVYGGLAAFSYQ